MAFRRTLALAAFLAGLLPLAPAAAEPLSIVRAAGLEPLARLELPRADAVLAAGSIAALEWAPAAGLDRLDGIEEWEAFLSVDGGATYPVRITPHLDRGLRRVAWTEALADPEESPSGPPIRFFERFTLLPPGRSAASVPSRGDSSRASDILLLTSRRNE